MLKTFAAMLLASFAAHAGTIAQTSCVGGQYDTETSSALCLYIGPNRSFDGYATATVDADYGVLNVSATSRFQIAFGVPFWLDGLVSAHGSDNGQFPNVSSINLGSFFVLDSNCNQLQSWTALAASPVATYSLVDGSVSPTGATPEPSSLLLAALPSRRKCS